MLPVQRALISVYDKTGLDDFARALAALGVELLSTGGTQRYLEAAGIPVRSVSEITEHPEILGGRVKTLHPRIHGGILADRTRAGHLTELQEHSIQPIDLVVCNLYPFEATVASGADDAEIIEMIDIGGPTMIRAAAKNHRSVLAVVDPGDYPQVQAALEDGELTVPEALLRALAVKAFRHTQRYDSAIAGWMARQIEDPELRFPRRRQLELKLEDTPRYGENPHQSAAVYSMLGGPGVLGDFEQLQGKALSYNNFLDADAARALVAHFDEPAVVIVKHNNPCGVGTGRDLVEAYERALSCDPLSAFGSIIAINRSVGTKLAEAMKKLFIEVIVTPGVTDEGRSRLSAKKNLRVLVCPPYRPASGDVEWRGIDGGFLAQTPDAAADDPAEWQVVTKRAPNAEEQSALELAWRVCRGVKSNAIVLANAHQTVGIGAGQMSRVDSCHLSVRKAREARLPLDGTAAASDAFFPFRDGLDVLAQAGITAVVQPGGSKRDDEVVAAADEQGLAMVITGHRHFRH
ncbi:MAG: bifunctional phosphoribosylaminoimidazolecarboxamide formyltransferase/IMP cyclohydrolase [Thermoanaerobaculia bacterium]|nr:bifunctional phosphoribosylaminoimidazolecarboxamide formyltransferase/IMP cyclohydrolase [Thermoanaerobaculia bacterium]